MANHITCTWVGASGKQYIYEIHSRHPKLTPNQPGNYIYAKLDAHGRRLPIHIGEGRVLLAQEKGLAADYIKAHPKRISAVMTRRVITASPETSLDEIAAIMEQSGIKRTPLVRDGRLVGIVSRAKLVQAVASSGSKLDILLQTLLFATNCSHIYALSPGRIPIFLMSQSMMASWISGAFKSPRPNELPFASLPKVYRVCER